MCAYGTACLVEKVDAGAAGGAAADESRGSGLRSGARLCGWGVGCRSFSYGIYPFSLTCLGLGIEGSNDGSCEKWLGRRKIG